jgi:hypothetical protein
LPLVVEHIDELVEAGLLLEEMGSGWSGSFFLKKCMRSWRPFCFGEPGLTRSIPMPDGGAKLHA